MKREEHKAAVEGKIISVARKLFLEQGYHNTKMRQIKDAADLKMGTIYHFYKNKEDIFAHIVLEAFFRVLDRTAKISGANTLLHLASELAWHVHTMAQHAPSAELYLMSYNSPEISEKMLVNQTERSQRLFGEKLPKLSTQDHKMYAMVVRGLMQTIALQAVGKTLSDPHFVIDKSVDIILTMMGTDQSEVADIIQQLHDLDIKTRVANALTN
ncbi:MAG: TetR/AcrR family transcriptional regulator [Bacteroidota bacterium]